MLKDILNLQEMFSFLVRKIKLNIDRCSNGNLRICGDDQRKCTTGFMGNIENASSFRWYYET